MCCASLCHLFVGADLSTTHHHPSPLFPVPLCVVPNMDCAFRSLRETPVAKHALRIYAEHRFPKGLDRTTVVKRNPNRERMLHGCAKTALYVAICVYVGGAVLAVLRAVVGW